jgi:hypothetical protein
MTSDLTLVTVTLEDRPGGGLRAYSDDLPGLMLSGPSADSVVAKIIPAIEALFDHQGFRGAKVRPTRPIGEVLQLNGARQVDVHVTTYVVELPRAA